ncbi:DUF2894 domain-containing protein [Limnohabitans radicicola]|uniref:DUF2894 domain-containing protein n=1 Tax=Limnohabitans radicicola TaxID=2771427 RepID=A0A927FHX8_9BURK|nr:DUF2894 domain-containing protein [Limnohabitans radicicola]MBD8050928.1 DUF2894 domain-containing protein [Limnohabitans radicicola]
MNPDVLSTLDALRAAGAPRFDAVGWHYIETLAGRTQTQSGAAQALLTRKLQQSLDNLHQRMKAAAQATQTAKASSASSPLATLLQELKAQDQSDTHPISNAWRSENPRIQQFRQQLSQISVQKQVTQAIAQAPQNAGPINSHMLVLRSLGLMRGISPDYLNRFMVHVDTLLCLDEADKGKAPAKKAGAKSPK